MDINSTHNNIINNNNKQNPSPTNSSSSDNYSTTTTTTPRPVSRPDPNPHPTTFIQADTTSFKQVVQMLTGSPNPTRQPDPVSTKTSIPPVKTGQQKNRFKLYERRNSLKTGLMINPSAPKSSARLHELLSPSILDFPSLVLSPVTPLVEDPFNKRSPSVGNLSEEERVISEKGFYLHPSPRRTAEPQLLTLFR